MEPEEDTGCLPKIDVGVPFCFVCLGFDAMQFDAVPYHAMPCYVCSTLSLSRERRLLFVFWDNPYHPSTTTIT